MFVGATRGKVASLFQNPLLAHGSDRNGVDIDCWWPVLAFNQVVGKGGRLICGGKTKIDCRQSANVCVCVLMTWCENRFPQRYSLYFWIYHARMTWKTVLALAQCGFIHRFKRFPCKIADGKVKSLLVCVNSGVVVVSHTNICWFEFSTVP